MSSEATRLAKPLAGALRLGPAAASTAFAVYAVLLLVGGWTYATLSIRSDQHRTLEAARDQMRVVAAGLEAQIGAMLNDGIGAALAAANQLEAARGLAATTDAEAAATLGRVLTGGPYVRSLFIGSPTRFARAGREGNIEAAVLPEWFAQLIYPRPASDSVVGSVVADPDRPPHRVIPVARRLAAIGDGNVWVGGLFDFHELNDRYRRSIGPANALVLLSLDGSFLVRIPNPRGVDITRLPTGDSEIFRRAMQAPVAGVIEGVAPLVNVPAIVAYQRLNDYPLYVAASVRRDSVLAVWEERRRDTLVFTAVASVIVIVMTWMLNHYIGALRGRELHYRTLFNKAGFSAFMLDGDQFIDANRTALSMFGMPKGSDMRGLHPWDVSPECQPDGKPSRELAQQRITTALEQGEAKFEWTHKRVGSGEPFDAEVELSSVRVADRALTLAVVHDITDRKRAEQSWRESEARYRALIESLPEAILVHRGAEPLFSNQAAATLVGAPSVAALIHHPVLSFVLQEDHEVFRERSRAILDERLSTAPREVRLKRFDGSLIWCEAQGVPVTFDGKPAVQTIVRDITARKLQEQNRAALAERLRQQSEALQRAVDESRELAGQLVRAQNEARRQIGRDLHDSTGQTVAALEMNLARLARGTAELSPEQRKVLAECIELAGQCSAEIRTASYLLHPPLLDELGLASALRWLADGFRQRSGIEVTLDLPSVLARFDKDCELALFRVAQEALTNVHRHSGSPSVRLAVRDTGQDIVLEIEDSGRGLSQAGPRLRESAPALSVGLAGMRERMRQIGGTLVVESGVMGTRVRATLPLPVRELRAS